MVSLPILPDREPRVCLPVSVQSNPLWAGAFLAVGALAGAVGMYVYKKRDTDVRHLKPFRAVLAPLLTATLLARLPCLQHHEHA